MAVATTELVWLRNVLNNLSFSIIEPIPIFYDNKSTIHIASNLIYHERIKHIELDCHFIREHIKQKLLALNFVPSHNQLTNLLTKGLYVKTFNLLLNCIRVHSPPT
ncbi:Uncharacterized protein TCM_004115 [Theobroma cacao]|uniref:Cysteine-rich RLK (RECEPTOR-like protein kinase) 8 n=1 Tax=Theobroma cacao TaxID=3641 RepID=A0A061DQ06_THECC|nr:Uncharacterized protein TCM_004115 [Theobroma cacao]